MSKKRTPPVSVTIQQGEVEITVTYDTFDDFCKAMERAAPHYRKFTGMRELVEQMQEEINLQF